MNEHDKILADLSAYLDGELTPAQAQRVEQALAKDPQAARELSALRRTRELVRGLPRVSPSADFVAGVLAKAERTSLVGAEAEPAGGAFPYFRWVAAAAVLLVAVGVGIAVSVMLYTTPADRTPGVPIASGPRSEKGLDSAGSAAPHGLPPGAGRAKDGSPAGGSGRDVTTGFAGNETLYASPDNFDAARKEVNDVLLSNGIQPTETKDVGSDGDKQLTIVVLPKDDEQARQLRAGLEKVRTRFQNAEQTDERNVLADRTNAESAGARRETKGGENTPAVQPARPVEIAAAQSPSPAAEAPAVGPAAPAPAMVPPPAPAAPAGGAASGSYKAGPATASAPTSNPTSASAPVSLFKGAAVGATEDLPTHATGAGGQTMKGLSGSGDLARTRSAADANVDYNFNAYSQRNGANAADKADQAAPTAQQAKADLKRQFEQQAKPAETEAVTQQRQDGGSQAFLITLQSQPPQGGPNARFAAKAEIAPASAPASLPASAPASRNAK
jgi:hypothetical protein